MNPLSFATALQYPALIAAVYYMGQPVKFDFLWAGLCLMAAVYFIFRT